MERETIVRRNDIVVSKEGEGTSYRIMKGPSQDTTPKMSFQLGVFSEDRRRPGPNEVGTVGGTRVGGMILRGGSAGGRIVRERHLPFYYSEHNGGQASPFHPIPESNGMVISLDYKKAKLQGGDNSDSPRKAKGFVRYLNRDPNLRSDRSHLSLTDFKETSNGRTFKGVDLNIDSFALPDHAAHLMQSIKNNAKHVYLPVREESARGPRQITGKIAHAEDCQR